MSRASVVALLFAAELALCCSGPAQGQVPPPPRAAVNPQPAWGASGGLGRFDCSRAPNPAKCDARRKEFRAQLIYAQSACEDRHGAEHHTCMIRTMCQQARDPQQCETIARRRAEHRQEIREACAGRTGDELRSCIRSRVGYDEPPNLLERDD